jgi:hypothetical protein
MHNQAAWDRTSYLLGLLRATQRRNSAKLDRGLAATLTSISRRFRKRLGRLENDHVSLSAAGALVKNFFNEALDGRNICIRRVA